MVSISTQNEKQAIFMIVYFLFFMQSVLCQKQRLFDTDIVEKLVRQWAPLVWLAPNEKFMPGNVNDFLHHVHAENPKILSKTTLMDRMQRFSQKIEKRKTNGASPSLASSSSSSPSSITTTTTAIKTAPNEQWSTHQVNDNTNLPVGQRSADWFLVTNDSIDDLLADRNSFVYGQNPNNGSIPIYAIVSMCNSNAPFRKNPSNDIKKTFRYIKRIDYIERSISNSRQFSDPENDILKNARPRKRTPSQFERNCQTNTTIPCFVQNSTDSKEFIRKTRKLPHFHVTYWMFYPFSQGKKICTISLGPLGRLPIPLLFGMCMGSRIDFGNHVGDWEHMTLYFRGNIEPEEMYVSAHDAGAYYSYERLTGTFEYRRQETRKGILQQPNFPKTVVTSSGYHPVMFSAQGSHGLWTAPGTHSFVRVPRLFDVNGFGTPWLTWKNIEISYTKPLLNNGKTDPLNWLQYFGRWGNPKSKCHPLNRVGLNFCEYLDGPTGIPQKKPHFYCND